MIAGKSMACFAAKARMRNRFLWRPSTVNSVKNALRLYKASRIKRPIRKAFCFSKCSQYFDLRCIAFIFSVCKPSTIFWIISEIIIAPVNLQAMLISIAFGPHQECVKGQPFSTNTNSSTAVSGIAIMPWVCASLNHPIPSMVEACSFSSLIMSVPSSDFCQHLGCKTPARTRVGQQFERSYHANSPAIAAALIKNDVVGASGAFSPFSKRSVKNNPCAKSVGYFNCHRFHMDDLYHAKDVSGNRLAVTAEQT